MPTPRKLLAISVAVAGGLLCLGLGYVLLSGLRPALDQGGPTTRIELASIPLDSYREIEWKHVPVVVYRPGPKFIASIPVLNRMSSAPPLKADALPPVFVYLRVSTYKGAGLVRKETNELVPDWPGAWVDPAHFGEWDYAGRRIMPRADSPPLPPLQIPQFKFSADGKTVELL